jgi:KUP system potassium uptake protein
VRHGYNDALEDPAEFESNLIQNLKNFIQEESFMLQGDHEETTTEQQEPIPSESHMLIENNSIQGSNLSAKEGKSGSSIRIIPSQQGVSRASSGSIQSLGVSRNKSSTFSAPPIQGVEEEVKFIEKAMEKGVVYLLGEAEVVAHPNSSFLNKIVVNYAYSFLRKNFRQGEKLMAIPRNRLLKVGMTYEI